MSKEKDRYQPSRGSTPAGSREKRKALKSNDNSKKSQKSQIPIRAEIVSVENSRRKPIEDKSTKKKEKKQLKDLFKHKTDDEVQRKVISQNLEFKTSN